VVVGREQGGMEAMLCAFSAGLSFCDHKNMV